MSNEHDINIEMSNRENIPEYSYYKYPWTVVKVYLDMGNRSGRRAQVNPPYGGGGGGYYGGQLTSTHLPYPRGNYNRCYGHPRPRPRMYY